jgi:photosystem II stability/assembly factor-like uncharacterized protein
MAATFWGLGTIAFAQRGGGGGGAAQRGGAAAGVAQRGGAVPQQQQPERPIPKTPAEVADGLQFRNIGPAIMGGRIDAFAVDESDSSTYYVGTASSGVWKTVNNGTTFEPVFDEQPTSTIGDMAIAPSNPDIVYVGTGEQNGRQSSSWGNGVYRSNDGGKTWAHIGLEDTQAIGRIAVHPHNPDIVYVAAAGHLWGPNKERGLYKSSDGGKTWVNTKFINEDTGFIDVAIDPRNPHILYAASYQRRRAQYGFNGGGPGSGLWKTTDSGATWTKLTRGLPTEGDIGRIGIAIYPKDPRVVYCLVEHATQDGIYRSDDGGETWVKQSNTNPRPSYYSRLMVDPNNDQRVWVCGASMYYTEDGGKTFSTAFGRGIHGDFHALWVDPADSDHLLAGSDGGVHVTYDRGRTWEHVTNAVYAQFYEVSADSQNPYYVYGGLQDNGSWGGPSRTLSNEGIRETDWFRVGGGDGFYCVIDPVDSTTLYTESQDGSVSRLNLKTNESKSIRPVSAEGERYRFNWNSPILVSPHDHNTVYYGGNRLFGSKDRGDTWTVVSPDLTSNLERDKMQIFGKTAKEMLSRNDGVVHYGTITAMAESPLRAGILWVGTDDGHLQVSRDGGKTFTDVVKSVSGVPKDTYVSRVEASRSGEGAAYAAFDGHRNNDFKVYIFKTEDFGQHWRSISTNIPNGYSVHVIREHPKNSHLLFAGTENGLWMSVNDGEEWHRMKSRLPTVPVFDLMIHPRDNDLIVATHGRGVWIMDDITPLQQLAEAMNKDLDLFDIRPGTMFRTRSSGNAGNLGQKLFVGPNPPQGVYLNVWVKGRPSGQPAISIADASGKVVRDIRGTRLQPGLNRILWDMRENPVVQPEAGPGGGPAAVGEQTGAEAAAFAAGGGFAGGGGGRAGGGGQFAAAGGGGGGRGGFGAGGGLRVIPGTFTVKLTLGQTTVSKQVAVSEDPRIQISDADLRALREATVKAQELSSRLSRATRTLSTLRQALTDLDTEIKSRQRTPEVVTAAVKTLSEKVEAVARPLLGPTRTPTPLGFAGAPLVAEQPTNPLSSLLSAISSHISALTARPNQWDLDQLEKLPKQIDAVVEQAGALEKEVPALNKLLFDNGFVKIDLSRTTAPVGGRGGDPDDER